MQFVKGATILGFQNFFENDQVSKELHQRFQEHINAEGLSYGTNEEYQFRLELFKKKDAEINYWNQVQDSFTLGHNMFSTMTDAEAEAMTGYIPMDLELDEDVEPTIFDDSDLQASIDWRSKGAVNSVKNQGRCGSCWAFAATAGTEAAHKIASGKLLNLAEQQLVSCVTSGCNGGRHNRAFEYLKSRPQVIQSKYPYKAQTGTCSSSMSQGGVVKVTGYSKVTSGSVSQHKAALSKGVVSIALASGSSVFKQYKSGILDSTSCGT